MQELGRACEEMTRQPDSPTPGQQLMDLLVEEFPRLAIVLDKYPEDVRALGMRLVCAFNLPENGCKVGDRVWSDILPNRLARTFGATAGRSMHLDIMQADIQKHMERDWRC